MSSLIRICDCCKKEFEYNYPEYDYENCCYAFKYREECSCGAIFCFKYREECSCGAIFCSDECATSKGLKFYPVYDDYGDLEDEEDFDTDCDFCRD